MDNPYLRHLPPSQRGSQNFNGKKDPLFGFVARTVTGNQARQALVRNSIIE